MNTKILDHIDFEKVNTLLEGFNQTTGFVTAILDLEGNVLSKSGWRQICTEFHRINPETAKRCTISDTVLANKMSEGEKYHFYKCLNGLVDVAVPIIIKGEHVANLFSGQFFFEEPDVSFFKKQAEINDFEESSYLKALEKVPIISQEKVKTAMNFLLNMTEMISEITFQKLEQIELNEERKKAANEINKQKSLFETMFNTIPDGVVITDTERVIKLANKGMKSTFGCEPEDLLGKSTKMLYVGLDNYQETGEAVFTDNAKKAEDLYITRYKDMSGREFPGETFGAKLFDENNQWIGNLGIMRDITERKQLEERLHQTQKMESIGNLAGGIAHDFNNLLYPIIGFSEMLKEDLPPDSPEHESAQEIFNAGRRGGELVKQILAFSRQSDHKLSPVRFQKILAEVCKLTRSTIPSDIEIYQDIQKDCGLVMAEETQLHQIAMNLITNAYHAVETTGGKISIQLRN